MNAFLLSLLICISLVLVSSATEKEPKLLRVCYYTFGNLPPSKLNTTLCTHIIAGFSGVKDGVIDLGIEAKREFYRQTTSLKKRDSQLKVLLTIGGGGNNGGFSDVCSCTGNRTRFIVSTLAALGKYNFDGLDIDWEFPVWNDYSKRDKKNFINFLAEFHVLSKAYAYIMGLDPFLLSVAVAAPYNIVDAAYDIPEMAKYIDFINLMSYDFHDYFWYTPFTGHNSPLFNRSVEKAYFATLNTAWAAQYWNQQGMPKSQIMVGIPTYGHSYSLINPDLHDVDSPSNGSNGDVTFMDVCNFIHKGGVRVFDNESKVPYAYFGNEWISYEDQVSISGKAKWIKEEGFGGAMTYDLNCDDWSGACDEQPFVLHRILHDIFTQ